MYKPSVARWYRHPPAGFRFSAADGAAIVFCAILTWSTWSPPGVWQLLSVRNIFRIPRLVLSPSIRRLVISRAICMAPGSRHPNTGDRAIDRRCGVQQRLPRHWLFPVAWGRRCNSFDGDNDLPDCSSAANSSGVHPAKATKRSLSLCTYNTAYGHTTRPPTMVFDTEKSGSSRTRSAS